MSIPPCHPQCTTGYQSQTRPQPDAQPMQTQLVTPSNDPGQVAPVEPEPVQEDQAQTSAPVEQQAQQLGALSSSGAPIASSRVKPWRSFSAITTCRRLTCMPWQKWKVRVRPLSNLQNGQMVQIRQNASGVVTGLTIDTGNGQQVLFTRQPDGSFVRAR